MDFEPDVNKSFNRDFTTYFLEKREKCFNFDTPKMKGEYLGKVKKSSLSWFELDKNVKINSQDGICYFDDENLCGCLVNKFENNKVFINKKLKIKSGTKIYRNFDFEYDKMLTNSKITRKIRVNFEYENNILKVIDEDGYTSTLSIEENEQPNNQEKMNDTFIKQLSKTGESVFYVNELSIKTPVSFIPVSKINEIRRLILENLKQTRIKNYKNEVQNRLKYAAYVKSEADYHENIHNKESEEFYKNCGCTVNEKSVESQNNFDKKELMRTKHCLKYAFDMCKTGRKLFLTDDKGKKYKLLFDCKNCEMVICQD
jgi:putative protease